MNQKKLSSKIYAIVKSACASAVLPVLFIYVMVAKPDYRILNGLSHVVLPVAQWVGDVITWPVRVIGDTIDGVGELSRIRDENEELRAQLDTILARQNQFDIAIRENKQLRSQLNLVQSQPKKTLVADVMFDNTARHHSTFIINRGSDSGIANGMAVVAMNNQLAGIVMDTGANFARVRSLTDSDTNIAVHIVGTGVYGFLAGNGSNGAVLGFFNNPKFVPQTGDVLTTSNISGVLPNGIMVGKVTEHNEVEVVKPNELTRVMILQFDNPGEYR